MLQIKVRKTEEDWLFTEKVRRLSSDTLLNKGACDVMRVGVVNYTDSAYLIPIKSRAPLTFVHLACAKIKGSKFAQYKSAEIKGRRKMARIDEKRQIYSKVRVREN